MLNEIELARHICLLALSVVCVYTDLARGKLYNGVTLSALALGLASAFLLDATGTGSPHLKSAVISAALGGGLLFGLYLLGGMGAGDVKFMAAVGALGAGWTFVLLAMVYTALVGAAIAIGVLIWQGHLLEGLKESSRAFFTFKAGKRVGKPHITVPYGVAIGIGTMWAWIERFVF